mmetsp:Transcript_17164/g.30097  ORF Transcript_17164/g.30097 Transcript_17164/m.30097 type:complete len:193 (-) Transcript_17164:365-943(-)|eukprot:CAMPEP_0197658646 /NCGR_PEP_ID=MMETSP1338-20131121/45359_1 /TAXON_ID=43686 ORGANISM="Pelagodinium beii, Strain RCC1491" /NCGR_SAMPLE_ID=MMETSP1338 /ASSEMBLY_ACC=CAM_ASM_000754 /LENGTH=192 /DNA_ID=CAMNT_0043235267 /DNA_START=53 /DNA_END=631 /DNA_ORIENTATION=+
MVKQVLATTTVKLPRGVKISVNARTITVEGKRGKLVRNFRHIQVGIKKLGARTVRIEMWYGNRKQLACVRTLKSHIDNMVTGVTTGFQYRLRFAYAHFPINVNLTNNDKTVEIRNYLGERRVRKIEMMDGVKVVKNDDIKDCLDLSGNSIEDVGRCAALIHQSCLAKNKDIRKFLDGIYVAEKGPIGAMKAI